MTKTTLLVAFVLTSSVAWAAGLSPGDPRLPPVQPGTIQPQPGAVALPPKTKEFTVWVFADIKVIALRPTSVRVEWFTRDGAASYRVLRDGAVIADVPANASPLRVVDEGLAPRTTASYTVLAIRPPSSGAVAAGEKQGTLIFADGTKGDIATDVLEASRTVTVTTPPVFADVKLTVLGPTTVKVDWQSRQDGALYRVIRNGIAVADVRQPPLTWVDDGLTPGATATYTVQALQPPPPPAAAASTTSKTFRGGTVIGRLSQEVVLEVSHGVSATTPALAPPVDLRASTTSFTSVRLTWTQPPFSTGSYQLYRDRQPVKQGTGTAADDTGVPRGTHIYAVQAMFAKADGTPLPGTVSQEVSIDVGPKLCTPGEVRQCDYRGSAGTSHCALGKQVCNAAGDAFGACQDTQFLCGNWDVLSFKECAFTGTAKHVAVLRDIPSGDSAEQYVLKHKAEFNGMQLGAMAYSRDVWGNHWGSFAVPTTQCFVYNFNFWKTCTSPLSGSNLFQDPNTGKTYREGFTGVCLGECFGSNERRVYNAEPAWGTEPFILGGAGPKRCETIVTKEFKW